MKKKLMDLLKIALPDIDFSISTTLVDDGILDSLAITTIISEISMEFEINIPFDELVTSNFNSIDSMIALIDRCPQNNIEI